MNTVIETELMLAWKYETNIYPGVCELAGEHCKVKCTFEKHGRDFVDVCEIEKWVQERLKLPCTAEGLADELAKEFNMNSEVHLTSHLHGPITCKAFPFNRKASLDD